MLLPLRCFSSSVCLSPVQITYLSVLDGTLQSLNYKSPTEDQSGNGICVFQRHFTCVVTVSLIFWLPGSFSIYQKLSEERVPFVTSSIRASRGRPGRLIDHERYGTGD